MLEVLRRAAPTNLHCQHAAAESTGLGAASFELVFIADALHWVRAHETGREVRRLLKSGGYVAIVQVELAPTPFGRNLLELLQRHNPKAIPRPADTAEIFALACPGVELTRHTYEDNEPLDAERLVQILATFSFAAPALGEAGFQRLAEDARALVHSAVAARLTRSFTLTYARSE
jgi:hypothetical protein